MKKIIAFYIFFNLLCFYSISQNLLAHYPFNGNANDITVNAYHGQVTNAVLGSDRYQAPDESYYFDGDGDYIVLPQNFDFPERTISLWFKAFSIPATSDNIIIGVDNANLVNCQFNIDVRNTNNLHIVVGNQGGSTTISSGRWYHIVLVINQTTYKLFVDGSEAVLGTFSNYHSGDGLSGMNIGTSRKRNSAFFHGAIDEIKIYSSALSDSDAIDLFTQYMVINDNVVNKNKVFPNPFDNKLFINYDENEPVTAILFNIDGRKLVELTLTTGFIDTDELSAGVYILKIFNKEGVNIKQEKVIKF